MITTYQIRNVLRIYGNQLKKRSLPAENLTEQIPEHLDSVKISMEARRKQVLSRMSNHLLTRVDPDRSHKEKENKEKGEIFLNCKNLYDSL